MTLNKNIELLHKIQQTPTNKKWALTADSTLKVRWTYFLKNKAPVGLFEELVPYLRLSHSRAHVLLRTSRYVASSRSSATWQISP